MNCSGKFSRWSWQRTPTGTLMSDGRGYVDSLKALEERANDHYTAESDELWALPRGPAA